jgi:hypothetical protein
MASKLAGICNAENMVVRRAGNIVTVNPRLTQIVRPYGLDDHLATNVMQYNAAINIRRRARSIAFPARGNRYYQQKKDQVLHAIKFVPEFVTSPFSHQQIIRQFKE